MRTIGIAAHSAEGGALCFITACQEGQRLLGEHMHPTVIASCIPMGLSMPAWEADDHATVGRHLSDGIRQVADAGADFWVCPDNTAHLVLEQIAADQPIPGLHIADVVCAEIAAKGWTRVGLLGTKWTMTGPVYASRFERHGFDKLIPDEPTRAALNAAIFDKLCQGVFDDEVKALFHGAIDQLKANGAECVVLGCTEIPIIVGEESSSLPTLDSTRLLAGHAVRAALDEHPLSASGGWLATA